MMNQYEDDSRAVSSSIFVGFVALACTAVMLTNLASDAASFGMAAAIGGQKQVDSTFHTMMAAQGYPGVGKIDAGTKRAYSAVSALLGNLRAH